LSSRLLNGGEHLTTEHTVVRSCKSKRKPFNSNVADYLLIIANLCLTPLAERHPTYAYALLPLSLMLDLGGGRGSEIEPYPGSPTHGQVT